MTEVISPSPHSQSPAPAPPTQDSSSSLSSLTRQISQQSREVRPTPRERVPSYAQSRMSQYSRSSARSRPASGTGSFSVEYPAFSSSLSYTLVRDFAYPIFHPFHYGAPPEPSGPSTPGSSEWNAGRRQSDPMEQWTGGQSAWTPGPWGGDGGVMMYSDPEQHHDSTLPSTSFGDGEEEVQQASFPGGEDDMAGVKSGKHRKSKSYASVADFERGRRRESGDRRGRTSGRGGADSSDGVFFFQGQQSDPAGRESLRQSRGHFVNAENHAHGSSGAAWRRDSPLAAVTTTLPHRNFRRSNRSSEDVDSDGSDDVASDDDEDHIPLDAEPHTSHSPVRNSMGPEDEELFAGPSLALYSFEPENSNELRLMEGQEIMVSYRHGQGWLVASDPKTGEQGLVPEAYVRLLSEIANYDPETGQFVDLDEEGEEEDEEVDGQDPEEAERGQGEQHGESGDILKEASGEEGGDVEHDETTSSEDRSESADEAGK